MADFLVIGDLEIPVAKGRAQRSVDHTVGEFTRATDGSGRSTEQQRKQRWEVTTPPLDVTDTDEIEEEVQGGIISCYGELFGVSEGSGSSGGVLCHVTVTGVRYVGHGLTHRRALTLLLREA